VTGFRSLPPVTYRPRKKQREVNPMFIAHYGAAFGAKLASPRTSLGTLFLASAFIDLLWPLFLLLGIEQVRIAPGITTVTPLDFHHYPYSHSLLAVLLWSGLLGAAYA